MTNIASHILHERIITKKTFDLICLLLFSAILRYRNCTLYAGADVGFGLCHGLPSDVDT